MTNRDEIKQSVDEMLVSWFNGERYDVDRNDIIELVMKHCVGAAPPAPSVAVKALEWRENWGGFDDNIVEWSADTPWGRVRVSVAGHRDVDGQPYARHADVPHKLRDRLQADAQADYEARIRSALSAQVQDVAGSIIKLGTYGRAYDRPEERRAYTYEHQPGNIEAYKLGRACSDIHSGGDWIDRGLNLLNSLQREGFGVFELPAAPAKQDKPD